ncbi:DUF4255 domain-containing protein [Arthrobacter sp. N199823]|uniref:DUF4255 domain-containing protein n=1 Tax=Arthrobacter sp. N199823 TaxID=2058895 RepID=UPI000CE52819|nr:DUF4255 domain-containing protein [Arthrobacter sp. N199823]
MSSSWALAAVTATLRNLLQGTMPQLDPVLQDLSVTTRTPDMARKTMTGTSLNVFLYETAVNAAWRNQDPAPNQGGPASPPLALNLHYLMTAYGRDDSDQDAVSHRVLGAAMGVLHDHSVLGADELAAALASSGVGEQAERIRITPLPLGVDELSKLWTAFQTNMRVSAAYEVSVVLIDSQAAARAPLPVLARGANDEGVHSVLGAAPALARMLPPRSQAAARQGETVLVEGSSLSAVGTVLRFTSLWRPRPPTLPLPPVELAPAAGPAPGQLTVTLPDLTSDALAWGHWVPGFYSVAALTEQSGLPPLVSGAVGLALAPTITLRPHAPATVAMGGTVTLTCTPRVGEGQNIVILCGEASVAPDSIVNPAPGDPAFASTPTIITFTAPDAGAGTHPVRLRVDGVDSIPVTYTGAVPAFDPAQQVILI